MLNNVGIHQSSYPQKNMAFGTKYVSIPSDASGSEKDDLVQIYNGALAAFKDHEADDFGERNGFKIKEAGPSLFSFEYVNGCNNAPDDNYPKYPRQKGIAPHIIEEKIDKKLSAIGLQVTETKPEERAKENPNNIELRAEGKKALEDVLFPYRMKGFQL